MKTLIILALLMTLPFSVLATQRQAGTNELLFQYCDTSNAEYEQSVAVGQGKKVMYHQGAFMQVIANTPNQAVMDYMHDQLVQVGVKRDCAQYLLSRAVADDQEIEHELVARVLFDFDKSELNTRSRYLLSQIKARIKTSDTELKLVGNTDSKGKASYNVALGLKRSQAVVDYLEEKDTSSSNQRFSQYSDGETHPISSNHSDEGRHTNRRVDISTQNPS
ncbi:OmpA family protein [Vibrio lamellibrachiae]|uniref:OmpA family protein n=1 Tax=Vibrio lamellibrachiae TaxID=2910253 RepID=UPI003D112E11